ncbi:PREDICTED: tigger transposable element-derived protein 6-like [Branchiostoma belcheri]|uniref:Tigger transposable element-derived protein 6-like n=1 Tax=Branchiostoma belcheri TaxID=7741 RepID=A0A6P4YRS7_BRABE|nr:PREDICTED: tigger transposable element-derived protein 6-like [Branchiostoma belcheri]
MLPCSFVMFLQRMFDFLDNSFFLNKIACVSVCCLITVEFVSTATRSLPTNMPINTPAKKRVDLTIADKVKVIKLLDSVPKLSQTEVGKRFGCSTAQVCRINKNREEIMRQWECNSNPNRKRKREGKSGEVEEALMRWFVNARAKNVPLSGPILMEKARQLAESLGDENFKPTDGWLGRWKQRNGIAFKRGHGEKKDADTQSAENWVRDVLPGILQEYDEDDIYNCDETGLLYRALPSGTLAQKTETVSGSKKAMDRISVMFCCNMTGTDKLTPLVIGHSRNPRCFRGQRVPLPWESNKKAWMTAAIFREWVRKIDVEMGRRRKKIVLLLDNCTAHPHDIPLENIRLVFLPANTTSLIQPLDQGIIRNFKGLYRAQMLRRVISAVDNDEIDNAQKFAKTTTVLDALFMVREAWKGVKDVTVRNCFGKVSIDELHFVNCM